MTTKNCRECGEPIAAEATKCKECGAYQGHRKYISDLTALMSLLIALLSVTGLSAQKIIESLEEKDSNTSAVFIDASTGVVPISKDILGEKNGEELHALSWSLPVKILLRNSGVRDSVIKQVRIAVYCDPTHATCMDGRTNNLGARLTYYGTEIGMILKAGSSHILDLTPELRVANTSYLPGTDWVRKGLKPLGRFYHEAKVSIVMISFSGEERTLTLTIDGQKMEQRHNQEQSNNYALPAT